MGDIYYASGNAAYSAPGDFISIEADANLPLLIHSIRLGQYSSEADAEAEMLRLEVRHFTGTTPSGGTAGTVTGANLYNPAVTPTVQIAPSTDGGTTTTIFFDSWNVQAGWLWLPTPEEKVTVNAGEGLAVFGSLTPTNSLVNLTASICFEQLYTR